MRNHHTNPLTLFVPMEIRSSIATDKTLPVAATGAVLSADLSGFTGLANALSEELGVARGAEQLAATMGQAFDGIIAPVHQYAGSVVGFSGDAITCWFDESDSAVSASARATAAGAAMLAAIDSLPAVVIAGRGEFDIAVRVAVASGGAQRFIVGDPAIQRFEVFGGSIVSEMAEASDLAAAGQLLVSNSVFNDVHGVAQFNDALITDSGTKHYRALREINRDISPDPWASPDVVNESALLPWVHDAVARRLGSGVDMDVSGFKPITAVFIQFELDYENTDADTRLDTLVCAVQRIATRHDGVLIDVTIGDKGSYLFIAFGAVRAVENSERQALETIAELRKFELPELAEASIGVSQGQVYAGLYGSKLRRTFGAIGTDVIIAARLMVHAGVGQTLVTRRIADAAAARFLFEPQEPVRLKGLNKPLDTFLFDPTQRRQHNIDEGLKLKDDLIGREVEQRSIAALLSDFESGGKRVLILEGEAGIGKSRLIGYTVQLARQKSLRCVPGFADPINSSSHYYVWVPVFESLLGLDVVTERSVGTTDDSADRRETRTDLVRQYFEQHLPESVQLAPLLNDVLSVQLAESDLTDGMTGEVRAGNTLDVLRQILQQQASAAPLVIVLEDAHWFDSASSVLLKEVALMAENILLVVSRRPVHDSVAGNKVYEFESDTAELVELMTVGSLERDATARVVGSALGVTSVDEAIADFIADKGEGSPFFIRELTYALRSADLLRVSGDDCVLAPGVVDLNKAEFPMTIQGVIASRIDQLSDEQQLALKVASIIGRRFGYAIVRDIYPIPSRSDTVEGSLRALDTHELLETDSAAEDNEYLFRHVLTQEVAYGLILHKHRTELHEQAGRWFEKSVLVDENLPVLAYHWSRSIADDANNPEAVTRAVDYLARAGDQALQQHAVPEASRFYADAIKLYDVLPADNKPAAKPDHLLVHLNAGLATAYNAMGEAERCQEATAAGLQAAGTPLPATGGQFKSGALREVAKQAYNRFRKLDISKAQPDDPATLKEEYYLLRSYSRSLWGSNDASKQLYANFRNLNTLERLGPSSELAVVYGIMVLTMDLIHKPNWSQWYGERSLDIARAEGRVTELTSVLVLLGLHHIAFCEWTDAEKTLSEAMTLAQNQGDKSQYADAAALLGDACVFQGNIERGVELYQTIYGASDRKGTRGQAALSVRTSALRLLWLDDADAALATLRQSQALLDGAGELLIEIDVHGLMAEANLRLSNTDEALTHIDEALTLIDKAMPPVAYPRYFGFYSVAWVLLTLIEQARGGHIAGVDPDSLMNNIQKHLKNYKKYSAAFSVAKPAALMFEAWWDALNGKQRSATKKFSQAIDEADTRQMRCELGAAHLLASRLGDSSSKALHQKEAVSVLQRIEHQYYLQLLDNVDA